MPKIAAFDTGSGSTPPEIEGLLQVATMAEDLNQPDTKPAEWLAALGRLACEATVKYFGVQDDVPPPPAPPEPVDGGATGPMEPKP